MPDTILTNYGRNIPTPKLENDRKIRRHTIAMVNEILSLCPHDEGGRAAAGSLLHEMRRMLAVFDGVALDAPISCEAAGIYARLPLHDIAAARRTVRLLELSLTWVYSGAVNVEESKEFMQFIGPVPVAEARHLRSADEEAPKNASDVLGAPAALRVIAGGLD